MSEKIHLNLIIPMHLSGSRLDAALATLLPAYSRSRIQQWIKDQCVKVNTFPAVAKQKILGGEQIILDAVLESETIWKAEDITLEIVFEDEQLIVINKPAGLVVHPGAGNPNHTLVNALLHHHPALAALPRAGLIHRIDKDTSGLLVIAKTLTAHNDLVKQLQARTMKRHYLAFVNGLITASGTIDAPVGRHPLQRTKMAVNEFGKPAVTHYKRLHQFQAHSYLELALETGRTHQIRVHLAHLKHPLLGDPLYGGPPRFPKQTTPELRSTIENFKRQALHAASLGFIHPTTAEVLHFESPLPEDMQNLLNAFLENED